MEPATKVTPSCQYRCCLGSSGRFASSSLRRASGVECSSTNYDVYSKPGFVVGSKVRYGSVRFAPRYCSTAFVRRNMTNVTLSIPMDLPICAKDGLPMWTSKVQHTFRLALTLGES